MNTKHSHHTSTESLSHAHTHKHTHTHTHTHKWHAHTHTHTHKCTRTQMHIHTHTHTHILLHTHAHTNTQPDTPIPMSHVCQALHSFTVLADLSVQTQRHLFCLMHLLLQLLQTATCSLHSNKGEYSNRDCTELLLQFSSRWYLCTQKSPYALHPFSQKFPQHCLWNGSKVHLIDAGPLALSFCRLSVYHYHTVPKHSKTMNKNASFKTVLIRSKHIRHCGDGDSSVVRVPDSWLKGPGFKSL